MAITEADLENIWTDLGIGAKCANEQRAQPQGPNRNSQDTKAKTKRLVIKCASEIDIEPVEWLWQGRLAVGKTTLVGGDPGLGKSQLSAYIAAVLSKHGRWPCNEGMAPQKNTIILSAEDSPADTIVPRLAAAGADCSKIHVVTAVQDVDAGGYRIFNLSKDIDALELEIRRIGNVGLISIDPVDAYIGAGIDSHKNAAVRAVLEPLSEMAGRLRVAVLAITHFSKQPGGKAIYRFIGSIAHIGAARIAFTMVADAENEGRVLILNAKNNLAQRQPGLAFRLEQRLVAEGIIASAVSFDSEHVVQTADEALAAKSIQRGTGKPSAKNHAAEFLRQVLADGPMAVADIEAEARAARMLGPSTPINKDKPFRAAKEELCIKSYQPKGQKGSGWVWEIPNTNGQAPSEGSGAHQNERAPDGMEGI